MAKFSNKPGKIGKLAINLKNWRILVISMEKLANFRDKAGNILERILEGGQECSTFFCKK